MAQLTAVVLTKNEEEDIERCLTSLQWADELLVIDAESTDQTASLAKQAGAKVVSRSWTNYADQRNFGLQQAKHEWVLMIDADEVVSEELRKEIQQQVLQDNEINGYFLKRIDYVFGKWLRHGEFENFKLLRLAKKTKGQWIHPVHEVWNIEGATTSLSYPILHYSHPSLVEFLEKINRYTTADAQNLFQQGIKTSSLSILIYPVAKFFSNYITKKGFLDGTHGLIFCLLMAFYSFTKRAKLWLLWWEAKKSSAL